MFKVCGCKGTATNFPLQLPPTHCTFFYSWLPIRTSEGVSSLPEPLFAGSRLERKPALIKAAHQVSFLKAWKY